MQWNDCETRSRKNTNTQAQWYKFLLDKVSAIPPHTYMAYKKQNMSANKHHAVASALWFKSVAGSEFSPNATPLFREMWFKLEAFNILSLLSSQHTSMPEPLYDPHFTYFDCFR